MQHLYLELEQIRTRIDSMMAAIKERADQECEALAAGEAAPMPPTPPMPKPFRVSADPQAALTPEAHDWILNRMRDGWSNRRLHKVTGVALETIKKRREWLAGC